jgi:uncharacterized alkaline shock family protein YloU
MDKRYIEVSGLSQAGKEMISLYAFSEIATYVLEDMPNVAINPKTPIKPENGVNIIVIAPITCRANKAGAPTVFVHIKVRKDENAAALAQGIQAEISEQITSMAEIPSCEVNVKIDGIF